MYFPDSLLLGRCALIVVLLTACASAPGPQHDRPRLDSGGDWLTVAPDGRIGLCALRDREGRICGWGASHEVDDWLREAEAFMASTDTNRGQTSELRLSDGVSMHLMRGTPGAVAAYQLVFSDRQRHLESGDPLTRERAIAVLARLRSALSAHRQRDSAAAAARIVRTLRVGTHTRVDVGNASGRHAWQYGRVYKLRGDSLLLLTRQDEERSVAIADITALEVDVSTGASRATHAWIGGGVGALAGAAVALIGSSGSHCAAQNGIPCGLGLGTVLPIAIGAGASAGAVVGAAFPVEHWQRLLP